MRLIAGICALAAIAMLPHTTAAAVQGRPATSPHVDNHRKGLVRVEEVHLQWHTDPDLLKVDLYLYVTKSLDVETGIAADADSGEGHFRFNYFKGKASDQGEPKYTVVSVDTSSKGNTRTVGFKNLGALDVKSVRLAPEEGYTAAKGDRPSALNGIKTGDVVCFRVITKGQEPTFGKFAIRSFTPEPNVYDPNAGALLDCVWQRDGSRVLE